MPEAWFGAGPKARPDLCCGLVASSGPGTQTVHDVKNYSVQTLDRLAVRLVSEEMARLARL